MRTLSLIFILLFISCSENLSEPNDQIIVQTINSVLIDKSAISSSASNLDKIRFEFKINDLAQSNIIMNDFVSANWTSDILGQIVKSRLQNLGFNYFSLSLPTGNHHITLKVQTTDSIFVDEIDITISDFTDFNILYQDSNWINYQSAFVRHIVVDVDNNKWFATSGYGVVKYNNSQFRPINEYNFNPGGQFIIQSFDIQSISLDPAKEIIYAGYFTDSYVTKIENDTILTFRIDPNDATNDIHSILADSNEILWIGLHNNGSFSKFDIANGILETIDSKPNSAQINFLNFGNNQNIIGTGLFNHIFSYTNSVWTEFLSGPRFSTVLYDANNNLWAASIGGLVKYDGINQTTFSLTNSGIPSNLIRDIDIDKTGSIWLGTQNGAAKFDGQNWTLYNTVTSPIISDDIRTIAVDSTNQIWIGTPIGISVFKGDVL